MLKGGYAFRGKTSKTLISIRAAVRIYNENCKAH